MPPARLVGRAGLFESRLDTLSPLVDFGQFVGQLGRTLSHAIGVGLVELAHQVLKEFVQGLQFSLQRFGRAGLKAAVVRFDARAVKGDVGESDQTERHGDAADLPEQILEGLSELGAEVIEGGVVDVPSFDEPHEVETVVTRFF